MADLTSTPPREPRTPAHNATTAPDAGDSQSPLPTAVTIPVAMGKTVCIVGAGPSGLVAAKTLLHDAPPGEFQVTIFDPQRHIGGLWPVRKDDSAGLVHPFMIANQSKHTVQFSDLAWEADAPELPRAWQVGRYLERYRDRYCSDAQIRLGWEVVRATPETESDNGAPATTWHVRVRSETGEEQTQMFDLLLVATGYFNRPAVPSLVPKERDIPTIHSSEYRDLETLLIKGNGGGGKILVVGGQMSGIEIAGTIASHLSSAANSPGKGAVLNPEGYSLHHIIQQPTWVFPLYTTLKPTSSAPPFAPLDLPAYNLNNRPQPLANSHDNVTADAARRTHSIFQVSLGTNQSNFSPLLTIEGNTVEQPPFLGMSDTYLEFVRSGHITLSRGKLSMLSGTTARVSPSGEEIHDIAAVVLATGFDASKGLSFLPKNVQETLSLAPGDLNVSIALAFHGTHHPAVPNLGFVGFYRSPYWGVMEMQARFLAAFWQAKGGPSSLPEAMRKALEQDTSIARSLSMRTHTRRSQFPMGDYAFLMQEFGSALGLERLPAGGVTPPLPHNGLPMDILTPARYASRGASAAQERERAEALRQTYETAMAGLTQGRFVARAVFRSLLGTWKLERDLVSKLNSHPSGHFSGTAKFLLREATRDGREGQFADGGAEDLGMEYLYVEEGMFRASNGLTFQATRRYVWRYDEQRDVLSQWFVRTDDQKRADYLFHEIEFVVPAAGEEQDRNDRGWEAKAGHLCVEDFYDVAYEFSFAAVNLSKWRIGYTVKGPKKDYSIDGVYTR